MECVRAASYVGQNRYTPPPPPPRPCRCHLVTPSPVPIPLVRLSARSERGERRRRRRGHTVDGSARQKSHAKCAGAPVVWLPMPPVRPVDNAPVAIVAVTPCAAAAGAASRSRSVGEYCVTRKLVLGRRRVRCQWRPREACGVIIFFLPCRSCVVRDPSGFFFFFLVFFLLIFLSLFTTLTSVAKRVKVLIKRTYRYTNKYVCEYDDVIFCRRPSF